MTPDTPDDPSFQTVYNGQISPGCPTADLVLHRFAERLQLKFHTPTIIHRTSFGTITPPDRAENPLTFLHPGSFVLFQLDNREYATQHGLHEDSESFARCLEFPTKRYAGLVLGSFNGESELDVQPYEIAFVGRELPPGSRCGSEHVPFAVPIAPTVEGNPTGRTPLCPKLFPWAGCYQYTVHGARIVPTHTYPSAIEYRLSKEDFEDFDTALGSDYLAALGTHHIPFSSGDEALLFQNMMITNLPHPLPVKVWQELSAEHVCHDPAEFVGELSRFWELAQGEVGVMDQRVEEFCN